MLPTHSRELVIASLTKQGRAALAAVKIFRTPFPVFQQLALRHERAMDGRVYATYSDARDIPESSLDARAIAQFSWNSLLVRAGPSMDWTTVAGDYVDLCSDALERTLHAAADREGR